MLGLALVRSCIAMLARILAPRTTRCTCLAYLVRYTASSVAESPPPTTAISCLRKIGAAPSQMAQAEMPRDQNSLSRGRPRRRAVAPVARMSELARTCRTSVGGPGVRSPVIRGPGSADRPCAGPGGGAWCQGGELRLRRTSRSAVRITKGRLDRSTVSTSSVKRSAPQRSACGEGSTASFSRRQGLPERAASRGKTRRAVCEAGSPHVDTALRGREAT